MGEEELGGATDYDEVDEGDVEEIGGIEEPIESEKELTDEDVGSSGSTHDDFLKRNLKVLIENLKKADINHINFDEVSHEVEGSMGTLNTAISGAMNDIKRIKKDKFAPKFTAVTRVDKDMRSTSPYKDLFLLSDDLRQRSEEVKDLNYIGYILFYTYAKRLEAALEAAKGVALSNEFLNRVENYTKSISVRSETFLERIVTTNEKAIDKLLDKLEQKDSTIKDKDETLIKTIGTLNSLSVVLKALGDKVSAKVPAPQYDYPVVHREPEPVAPSKPTAPVVHEEEVEVEQKPTEDVVPETDNEDDRPSEKPKEGQPVAQNGGSLTDEQKQVLGTFGFAVQKARIAHSWYPDWTKSKAFQELKDLGVKRGVVNQFFKGD